jgi:hypothetical protein
VARLAELRRPSAARCDGSTVVCREGSAQGISASLSDARIFSKENARLANFYTEI